jgi:hypothetical protein
LEIATGRSEITDKLSISNTGNICGVMNFITVHSYIGPLRMFNYVTCPTGLNKLVAIKKSLLHKIE